MSYEFVAYAKAHGLIIDHIISGKWVRVPTVDHPHKRNGAYYFGGDYAHIQNWAEMEKTETWFTDKPMTEPQKKEMKLRMEASKKERQKEREQNQIKAAQTAAKLLAGCELSQFAYMDSKGMPDELVNVFRVEDGSPFMVVPMFFNGNLVGAQKIAIGGEKRFIYGQRTNDAYFKIGQSGREFLCEGYATAMSVKKILDAANVPATVYACFSAGNVARMAKQHPTAFVFADNDASGTGQRVAAEIGLQWWMPPTVGHDVNDYLLEVGLFTAMMTVKKVLMDAKKQLRIIEN